MTDPFVHLHVHTEYSLLDGACRISEYVSRIKEMGQQAAAITDHGVMYGAIDFYKECKKQGIRPIIGCEVYVARRTRFDKVHRIDISPYHLVLLCKNMEGYRNLCKLVSLAYIDGFYNKPRVDEELLRKYSGGLIALSACLAGQIPQALLHEDYETARKYANNLENIFGKGNFYLELQNHGIHEQQVILPKLIQLSKDTGIGLVATNDAHYIHKEDARTQNILICIQTNHVVGEDNGMEFATDEFYLKSGEEMQELFSAIPEALSNTAKIAEQCQLDFEFGVTKLPRFYAPDGQDNTDYFMNLCTEGLTRIYGENCSPEIRQRLEYETSVIKKMGYVDYFLIVADFIQYAKSQGIPVGPGRGSGAGSLAAYCMGITGIDPLKYNLLFERFLNPERVSMPDFDIDFCYERRGEVIDYVIRKYGSEHVAQIITFGTMAAKGAIRDVGRALGMPYQSVDAVAKKIPFALGMTIEKALKESKDLNAMYHSDRQVKDLIDTAQKIEGMPRHASTHAAGVVITDLPVVDYVPLQKTEEMIVTQYPMTTLEELGLLKMDFLGLRNLTVIHYAQEMIRGRQPDFDINQIPTDDKAVYDMLSTGQSNGVFQFESGGMKQVLVGLRPENLEDLIAIISLYRPGPMDSIPRYIQNRHHPEQVTYKHPMLKEILDVTYGCIVYQEQVMQICQKLAGFSLGRADLIRRAMAKKKHDVMEKERHNFIYGIVDEHGAVVCPGAVRNGVSKEIANEIFEEMSSFASYAFNKPHAAAYAYLAYQTAYLKCHYPKEYMAALMSSVLDNTSKIIEYINECHRLSIKVLPPDVNESSESFTVCEDGIRFGLLAIKNLGKAVVQNIIRIRKKGKFTSFFDFCERMYGEDVNKRAVESLIRCGALDSFPSNRRQMLQALDSVLNNIDEQRRRNVEGQLNLFENPDVQQPQEPKLPYVEDFSLKERLMMEKDTIGIYVSGHPVGAYERLIEQKQTDLIADILEQDMGTPYQDKTMVGIVCAVESRRTKNTKNGALMAFLTIEDTTSSMSVLVFPKAWQEYSNLLTEGNIVYMIGKLSISEEDPVLLCEAVYTPAELQDMEIIGLGNQNSKGFTSFLEEKPIHGQHSLAKPAAKPSRHREGLYLKMKSREDPVFQKAFNVISIFEGITPVYVYFEDTGKYTCAPKHLWTTVNKPLLKELKYILGDERVVVRLS